jgi:PAS domain S-box-containing protein
MCEPTKNEETNNNDFEILLEERNNLLLRLKNYSNIQQKLIAANQVIDKQLENYKRLNNYIKIFVEAHTIQAFKSQIPEAIIDVFNFESAMVVFEDQYHSAIFAEGLGSQYAGKEENIFSAIKECTKNQTARKSFFVTQETLSAQPDLHAFDTALVVKFDCAQEYYRFFLVGFVSKKGANNYDPIKAEELIMFDNFSEQMFSILRQFIYRYDLNSEKEKYLSVIDNMNLGLLELDKNDYIRAPNNRFCAIFGYEKEELIGKSAYTILFENIDKKAKNRQDTFACSAKGIQEIEILTQKGELRNLLFTTAPNYDTRGNINGSIGIYLDITKTKELERELSSSNIELKKINSELDTFVYRVTHDLRTPVLSITGLIDIIKYESDKTVAQNIELINLVAESTQRLDDTIQEILNYSINARLDVELQSTDVSQTVLTIYNDIKFATNKKIDFECNFNAITHIKTDPFRFETILKNIIGNAVKYSNQSSDKPTIKFNIDQTAKNYVITISDNGLGIKEEYIDKIFNMFFRGTSNSVGTGLGLFIVKEAVERLKGNIKVNSKLNVGTTFIVTLPKKL